MNEELDGIFKHKFTFLGKRYGISNTAIRSRLRCYLTHLPFTRKRFTQFHQLDCGSLIICPLDGFITNPDEIIQAMFDDPAFDVEINKEQL